MSLQNKHAYLIIAHNEYPVLRTLLSMLDDERNDIYLYIDRCSRNLRKSMHHYELSKIHPHHPQPHQAVLGRYQFGRSRLYPTGDTNIVIPQLFYKFVFCLPEICQYAPVLSVRAGCP